MGKDRGRDAHRANFARLLGAESSRRLVEELSAAAVEALRPARAPRPRARGPRPGSCASVARERPAARSLSTRRAGASGARLSRRPRRPVPLPAGVRGPGRPASCRPSLLAAFAAALASIGGRRVHGGGVRRVAHRRGRPASRISSWRISLPAALAALVVVGWRTARGLRARSPRPSRARGRRDGLRALGRRRLQPRARPAGAGAPLGRADRGRGVLSRPSARAPAFLARAYAHSRVLPSRRRSRIRAGVGGAARARGRADAARVRAEAAPAPPPRPSPRPGAVVVVAVDGLALGRRREAGARRSPSIFAGAAAGWWPARPASPPEIWTDLATGEPPERHGVRALERVRPLGSPLAVRAPFGNVVVSPASRADARARHERAGLGGRPPPPHLLGGRGLRGSADARRGLVGLGAVAGRRRSSATRSSSPARATGSTRTGGRASSSARAGGGERIRTVYLPGLDILRGRAGGPASGARRDALRLPRRGSPGGARAGRRRRRARGRQPRRPGSAALRRMLVFDGAQRKTRAHPRRRTSRPRSSRAPEFRCARDLPGVRRTSLFAPGILDTETVSTYGPRVAPRRPGARGPTASTWRSCSRSAT